MAFKPRRSRKKESKQTNKQVRLIDLGLNNVLIIKLIIINVNLTFHVYLIKELVIQFI